MTLYWLALRETGQDYKAFVHLLGPDGSVIAQHDGDPVGGYTPTTRWRPGEIIADRHVLTLPEGLPAGEYGLRAGLYQVEPLRNLTVDPPAADNRVDIGEIGGGPLNVLVVSSTPEETTLLSLIAEWIGCDVVTAAGVQEASDRQVLALADVIALVSGNEEALAAVRRVRRETLAPLLVITTPLSDALHTAVLDGGADLAIQRPYQPTVLAAQLRALVRRAMQMSPVPFAIAEDLELDRRSRTVRIGDGQVHQLSPLEFRLLEVLLAQRGQPVRSETIIMQVWNYRPEDGTDLVRKLVNRLRAKIEPDPSHPEYVITVPGTGYSVREGGLEWRLDGDETPSGMKRVNIP